MHASYFLNLKGVKISEYIIVVKVPAEEQLYCQKSSRKGLVVREQVRESQDDNVDYSMSGKAESVCSLKINY
jgi:hypothetical protein